MSVEFSTLTWQLIIRFPQKKEGAVRSLLQKETSEALHNTLIKQSKMNQLVKTYSLAIDIVDEYDRWTTVFQQKSFWKEYARLNNVEVPWEELKTYPELADPIRFEFSPGKELWI